MIDELERWCLRRRQASSPPRANLALVAEDPGTLRQFGSKITEYLNEVDDPENGGWFMFDDELLGLLESGCVRCSALVSGDKDDDPLSDLIAHGGAVIVSSGGWGARRGAHLDVQVLLTGSEGDENGGSERGEGRPIDNLCQFHAAVNAGRLPGRMVVCLVGDAVLEWSYRNAEGALQ